MGWLCCRLKTHLQGLPVCRVSFTGETLSSWFVWFFYYYLEKRKKTSSLQYSWFLGLSGPPLLMLDKVFKERNVACQTLSLQNDRGQEPLRCEGCLLQSGRVGEANVQNQPIGEKVHRSKGAGAACVLWLSSSHCCSVSARVAPIGMFVLITLAVILFRVVARQSGLFLKLSNTCWKKQIPLSCLASFMRGFVFNFPAEVSCLMHAFYAVI